MSQRIEMTTTDGVKVIGSWVSAPTTVGAAVLVHAYPATKESWSLVQSILAKRGIASLAIDLRGHGESIHSEDGQLLDYRGFSEEETLSSMKDLRASYEWIRKRGIDQEAIVFIGASIGANFCLRALTEYPMSPAAVLLSPGMNYHGVSIAEVIENVTPDQAVWMAASSEDDATSFEATSFICDRLTIEKKVFKRLRHAGHGLMMLEGDAALSGEIADWVRDRIQDFELSS